MLRFVQGGLPPGDGEIAEARGPDSEQPDSLGALLAQLAQGRTQRLVHLPGQIRRSREGHRPRQCREIAEAVLQSETRGHLPLRTDPVGDLVGQAQQFVFEDRDVPDVLAEGVLRADRVLLGLVVESGGVSAVSGPPQLMAVGSEDACGPILVHSGEVADESDSVAGEPFLGLLPHPGQRFDRHRVEELLGCCHGDEQLTVRFRPGRGEFRHDPADGDADRGAQTGPFPNLGTQLIVLTDNVMPADARSERMLVAVEITNVAAIRQAVRQAMEVEPDATLIPSGVAGVDVYRVLRSDEPSDFEAELFDDLGLGADLEADAPPPLLNQWAITVIEETAADANRDAGYLIFSSHPELLLETIGRFHTAAADSLAEQPDVQAVSERLLELGGNERLFERIARTNLAFRAKYSLAREGRLRDSDSLLATLFRRIFEAPDEARDDLGTDRLPPFEQIEKYFRPAGGVSRATEQGWTLDGFLMK